MGPERTREIKSFGTAHRVRACVRARAHVHFRASHCAIKEWRPVKNSGSRSNSLSVNHRVYPALVSYLDEFYTRVIWRHAARIIRG